MSRNKFRTQQKFSSTAKSAPNLITFFKVTFYFSDIKKNLALAPSTTVVQPPSISPFLMPALAVSVVLNIVTGGAVISNYFNDPTSRNDVLSEPYQVNYFLGHLVGLTIKHSLISVCFIVF